MSLFGIPHWVVVTFAVVGFLDLLIVLTLLCVLAYDFHKTSKRTDYLFNNLNS